jgi:hypothetical protein
MCSPLALTLAPSKTHKTRRAVWLPAADDLADGTLTIVLGRKEVDSYRVQLVRDERGDLTALLVKPAPADPDVYEARRVERGWVCTCTGHARHRHCKHADALLAVESEGMLDG